MARTLLLQRRESIYALPLVPPSAAHPARAERPHLLAKIDGLTSDYDSGTWTTSGDGTKIIYRSWLLSDAKQAASRWNAVVGALPSVLRIACLRGGHDDHILFTLPGLNRLRGDAEEPFFAGKYALRTAGGHVVEWLTQCADDEVDCYSPEDGHIRDWEEQNLGNREIRGVRWSASGRELFVSLRRSMPGDMSNTTTCVVHLGATCFADTNHKGEWQRRLPANITDEHNGLLLGAGIGRTTDSGGNVCNACSRYGPIYTAERSLLNVYRSLLPPTFDSKHKPPYAYGSSPTFAPDLRTVAFDADGIWLVDRHTRRYHRLTHEPGIRQIAWESPTSLLVLKGVSDREKAPADLYRVTLDPHYRFAHRPTRLMENVDRFQLLDGAA